MRRRRAGALEIPLYAPRIPVMAESKYHYPGQLLMPDLGYLTEAQLEAELEWAEALDPDVWDRDRIIGNIKDFLMLMRGVTDEDWERVFGPDKAASVRASIEKAVDNFERRLREDR